MVEGQPNPNADFQSQFFGVFCKDFQSYSVVLLEDGKYHSIPVNSHPALTEALNTIIAQYKMEEHPLFIHGGVNRKLLGNADTVDEKAGFNLHKALAYIIHENSFYVCDAVGNNNIHE